MAKKAVAIIGSYLKGHIIDSSVSAFLEGAEQGGASHGRCVHNDA